LRPSLAFAGLIALVLASAPCAEGAGADRPRVALSVSPARLALAAPGSRAIKVRNDGAKRVVVDATRRMSGRQTPATTWLQIVPARVVLRSGKSATLTLRARRPRRAEPGDHHLLVLLTTSPPRGGRVNVQVRLGVRVRVVVPGRIVRQLTLGGLRVRRGRAARFLFVSVANRGNVTVQLHGCITALLVRRGQQLARLRPRVRSALLPRARALLALRYGGRARGPVTAVVRIRLAPGIRSIERRYRLRL
jgi:hypothetical protein